MINKIMCSAILAREIPVGGRARRPIVANVEPQPIHLRMGDNTENGSDRGSNTIWRRREARSSRASGDVCVVVKIRC